MTNLLLSRNNIIFLWHCRECEIDRIPKTFNSNRDKLLFYVKNVFSVRNTIDCNSLIVI